MKQKELRSDSAEMEELVRAEPKDARTPTLNYMAGYFPPQHPGKNSINPRQLEPKERDCHEVSSHLLILVYSANRWQNCHVNKVSCCVLPMYESIWARTLRAHSSLQCCLIPEQPEGVIPSPRNCQGLNLNRLTVGLYLECIKLAFFTRKC